MEHWQLSSQILHQCTTCAAQSLSQLNDPLWPITDHEPFSSIVSNVTHISLSFHLSSAQGSFSLLNGVPWILCCRTAVIRSELHQHCNQSHSLSCCLSLSWRETDVWDVNFLSFTKTPAEMVRSKSTVSWELCILFSEKLQCLMRLKTI